MSIFEIDIMTDKGRFMFCNHGIDLNFYPVKDEKTYGNYPALDYNFKTIKTNLKRALLVLAENAIEVIEGGEALCSDSDAIKVHDVYDYIFGI